MRVNPSKREAFFVSALIICLQFAVTAILIFTSDREANVNIFMFILKGFSVLLLWMFFSTNYWMKQSSALDKAGLKCYETKYEGVLAVRASHTITLAAIALIFAIFMGVWVSSSITDRVRTVFLAAMITLAVMVICVLLFNIIAFNVQKRRLDEKSVKDMQEYFASHRDNAEEARNEKLKMVNQTRHISDACSVFSFIVGFAVAFCANAVFVDKLNILSTVFSLFFMFFGICRIRFKTHKSYFESVGNYVTPEDYPELYKLVRKAADTVNCGGKIKIALITDHTIGIAKICDSFSIQIGATILGTFTYDELYNCMLHEFAHALNIDKVETSNRMYYEMLNAPYQPHILSKAASYMYCYWDYTYILSYQLFLYASSLIIESNADAVMAKYGDKAAIASSLIKLGYMTLHEWEEFAAEYEPFYEPETYMRTPIVSKIDDFNNAIGERAEFWDHLIGVEIISKSASHPTVKMRLEALGVNEYKLVGANENDTEAYKADCTKAINSVQDKLNEVISSEYENYRNVYYVKNKEIIDEWEEKGRPVVVEEYYKIIDALMNLRRVQDVLDVCRKVRETLDETAQAYAYYIEGLILLHKYDPKGIEFMYKSIELSKNDIYDKLDAIGVFCCMTGRQAELDEYREKSAQYGQENADKYSKLSGFSNKDKLCEEHLPDGVLDEILSYIKSVDKTDMIEKIYLVRKVITDDFFASVFIIQFDIAVDDDLKYDILESIFRYLDTAVGDWQYMLRDYSEVYKVKFTRIKNACVYERKKQSVGNK